MAGLRQAREGDIIDALRHMKQKVHHHGEKEKTDKIEWTGQAWERQDLEKYLAQYPSACLLLLDEYIIDVTRYLGEHVSALTIRVSNYVDLTPPPARRSCFTPKIFFKSSDDRE